MAQPARRRGRPVPGLLPEARESLLAAAAAVYAAHGYHGTTVEMILQQAGVSRPTFYRSFRDKQDILAVVVADANEALRRRINVVLRVERPARERLESAIDAYLDWGREQGPLVGPLYGEIGDPQSPVGVERLKVLADLAQLFIDESRASGRPPLDPLLYDALLRVVEYLGSQLFTRPRFTAADLARTREVILRIVLASLAEEGEELPPLPLLR